MSLSLLNTPCEPDLYAWMTIEYGTSHLKRRPQIFQPYKKRMERLKITPLHDKDTVVRVFNRTRYIPEEIDKKLV